MKQFKKFALLCALFFASITDATQKKQIQKIIHVGERKKKNFVSCDNPVQVTVWVHGTRGLGFISDLIHSVPDHGIKRASELPFYYHIGSVIKTLSEQDSERFPLEHFYVFGWSGKLSFDERAAQAKELHAALTQLVGQYTVKYGHTPTIRLITHSHGGNVVLNMAKIKDPLNPLTITQAILLACPVQHETKQYASDPMFAQVYSLYSTRDLIQILDPQGLYVTQNNEKRHLKLSGRTFDPSANVRQAKLTINEDGIGHAGFIYKNFAHVLPAIIDEMETWHDELQENVVHLAITTEH